MNPQWLSRFLLGPAFVVMVTMTARSDGGPKFVQTNLVSDIPASLDWPRSPTPNLSTPGVFRTALRVLSGSRTRGITRLPSMPLQTRRRSAR